MSKIRNRDTGTFAPHAVPVEQPNVDKLDLRNSTRPVVNNFKRPVLDQDQGRARPTMPAISQGPTVPPQQ